MAKKRAVLTTGYSVVNIKRGPEREKTQTTELKNDLNKLEKAYPPHKGLYVNQGEPLYIGPTDEIFD